ncbi:hypothetical protein OIO90_001615 [Microbotryomycetes sp. JL221]|nr:hypothetical protein OIO90_001615 [Microbotryomycetes sp. JL221]
MSAGLSANDLETYEYQLSQIKLALDKDPTNAEYLNLKDELQSLIDLTKELLASQTQNSGGNNAGATGTASSTASTERASTPSTHNNSKFNKSASAVVSKASPSHTAPDRSASVDASASLPALSLKTGDECQARYSGDGRFYPARITTIGGSDAKRVYSVIFQGYSTTELVDGKDVKPLADHKKREIVPTKEDEDKERKRKKYEKKAETKAAKTAEQGERQKTWQSFAKKSTKKGVVIPGMQGGSMFRSPEDLNPNARVGVVGSGKGLTKAAERKRQTFLGAGDE